MRLARLNAAGLMGWLGDSSDACVGGDELRQWSQGLICLTGGPDGPVNKAMFAGQRDEAQRSLGLLKEIFGDRLYVELQRHSTDEERLTEPAPYSPGDNPNETLGTLLHLIAFHQAYHVGQLGLGRRLIGKVGGVQ